MPVLLLLSRMPRVVLLLFATDSTVRPSKARSFRTNSESPSLEAILVCWPCARGSSFLRAWLTYVLSFPCMMDPQEPPHGAHKRPGLCARGVLGQAAIRARPRHLLRRQRSRDGRSFCARSLCICVLCPTNHSSVRWSSLGRRPPIPPSLSSWVPSILTSTFSLLKSRRRAPVPLAGQRARRTVALPARGAHSVGPRPSRPFGSGCSDRLPAFSRVAYLGAHRFCCCLFATRCLCMILDRTF